MRYCNICVLRDVWDRSVLTPGGGIAQGGEEEEEKGGRRGGGEEKVNTTIMSADVIDRA